MIMFCECRYEVRVAYMIFLILTMIITCFMVWQLIKGRRGIICVTSGSAVLVLCFAMYCVLYDEFFIPSQVGSEHKHIIPFIQIWIITAIILVVDLYIIKIERIKSRGILSENSIKEALDEMPMGFCAFRADGMAVLYSRKMHEIAEIMCGRVFLTYDDFRDMLEQIDDWKDLDDVYNLPDGTFYQYAEKKLIAADGECFKTAYFFDVTELIKRKHELESQNEELRKLSAEIFELSENIRQLSKEEEILSIKTRWHDIMGEGLTAIRRMLLSSYSQKDGDKVIRRWGEAVNSIWLDNEDSDQCRDEIGDLFRDADALNIELIMIGAIPAGDKVKKVFCTAIRNCLLNAAQHAKATKLYAEIEKIESVYLVTVSNNGIAPLQEIKPKGGLVNVINSAERIGGKVEIKSLPRFELRVFIPSARKDTI